MENPDPDKKVPCNPANTVDASKKTLVQGGLLDPSAKKKKKIKRPKIGK